MASKKPPQNPVSDEDVEQFDEFVAKWRTLLNLRDWRIVRKSKRNPRYMAEMLTISHEHKLATYNIGVDFGEAKVTKQSLEATACHELLHLLLAPLIASVVAEGEENTNTLEYEHAVIVILTELLMNSYGEKDADAKVT